MQTTIKTPAAIFSLPQRLLVPLFQRPYVWNEKEQWEPLWNDVKRTTERFLESGGSSCTPHFMGAVVTQSVAIPIGELPANIIIDGQQRLTTIQILLDAIQLQATVHGEMRIAEMLTDLTHNKEYYCKTHEDRFKVWPTNHDRPAFREVMSATHPFDHHSLQHRLSRIVLAHAYFTTMIAEFVQENGTTDIPQRLGAIEKVVRELFQIVVIQLDAEENAQEIFETLNARGSLLTAADLVKNFVFQNLRESGADVEQLYNEYWLELEDAFWERETQTGAVKIQLSSLFLFHWLNSQTDDEFVIGETFTRFKRYALQDTDLTMVELLVRIKHASKVYRSYIEASESRHIATTRYELFAYRMGVIEADTFRAVVLALHDSDRNTLSPLSAERFNRCLQLIETWLVRRVILRLPTTGLNRSVKELLSTLRANEHGRADEVINKFIISQTAQSSYMPDDTEIERELLSMPTYKRMAKNRLRMILEAIEDNINGFDSNAEARGTNRVPTRVLTIEHLMPQTWETHWTQPADGDSNQRTIRIHQLGNLTLLRHGLNSAISNGSWTGAQGKYTSIQKHGFLSMAMDVINNHQHEWTDLNIVERTSRMVKHVLQAWPAPEGYKTIIQTSKVQSNTITISDLLSAGLLEDGQEIVPVSVSFSNVVGTILGNGKIKIGDTVHDTPSGAGRMVRGGKSTNGWGFWRLKTNESATLRSIRQKLRRTLQPDENSAEEQEGDGEADGASVSTNELRRQFWAGLNEYAVESDASFVVQPGSSSYKGVYPLATRVIVQVEAASFTVLQGSTEPELRVVLALMDREDIYERLLSQKAHIESELGNNLVWLRTEGVHKARVFLPIKADFTVESHWLEYYEWYVEHVEKFIHVFKQVLL